MSMYTNQIPLSWTIDHLAVPIVITQGTPRLQTSCGALAIFVAGGPQGVVRRRCVLVEDITSRCRLLHLALSSPLTLILLLTEYVERLLFLASILGCFPTSEIVVMWLELRVNEPGTQLSSSRTLHFDV